MGIYDREYYRDSVKTSGWVTGQTPVVKGLILACVGVFVLQLMFDPQATNLLALIKPFSQDGWQFWRLITAAFCHSPGNLFHILFNMLFLWWFGRELEQLYGPREFLAFYLEAALVASLFFLILPFGSPVAYMVGASGAVLGVATLYTTYYPRRVVNIWGIVPIEMRWLLLLYAVADFASGYRNDGVAHAAHLGGIAYGLLFRALDLRLARLGLIGSRLGRPKLKVFHPPESRTRGQDRDSLAGTGRSSGFSERLELEMDQVLEKIQQEGQDSLTEHEREVLQRASQELRGRRSDPGR